MSYLILFEGKYGGRKRKGASNGWFDVGNACRAVRGPRFHGLLSPVQRFMCFYFEICSLLSSKMYRKMLPDW